MVLQTNSFSEFNDEGMGHTNLKNVFRYLALAMVIFIVTLAFAACRAESKENKRQFIIGLVTNNPNGLRNVQGFKDGMEKLGYIEGKDVTYVFEGSPTKGEKLDAVLRDMVEAKVDLIFTAGTPTGVAAHRITEGSNIPVVFGVIADPIAAGVMKDLTQPGGNMTGVKLSQNQARRLELLMEIVPGIRRIFVPYNPDDAAPLSAVSQLKELVSGLGIEMIEGLARNDDEVTELIHNIPQGIDAIFMLPDSMVNAHLAELLTAAFERKLPVSGPSIVQVEKGTLTAYGIIHHEAGAQAAHIADQVLKGVDPGGLPVETAEFFLGINLKTAEAIGLDIPPEILQQAEFIIRVDE